MLLVTTIFCRERATAAIKASNSPVGLPIFLSSDCILPNSIAALLSKSILGKVSANLVKVLRFSLTLLEQ